MAAGGRIAFDRAGYVFLSLGMKSNGYRGIQDLGAPDGKIHRLHDDGRVPADNPFADRARRAAQHLDVRTPQRSRAGVRPAHGRALGHGDGPSRRRRGQSAPPRPELRLAAHLQRGPLQRSTLWTAPASASTSTPRISSSRLSISHPRSRCPVSSSTRGDAFPGWRGPDAGRKPQGKRPLPVRVRGRRARRAETIIEDLARIRDIEVGPDGAVYLL